MRSSVKKHPVVAFLALAFAITWGLDALRLLLGLPGPSAGLALQVAGGRCGTVPGRARRGMGRGRVAGLARLAE